MPISLGKTTYTQDFDGLAGSGTSSALPEGWAISELGTSANATYAAGTGSSNSGDTYSFGTDADRALGRLQSGSNTGAFGAGFVNDTGAAITGLDIAYTGEEWRLGTAGRQDRLDFQISFDATSLTTGSWTDVNQLDVLSPDTVGTGAKNGNLPAEQAMLAYMLGDLDIAAGASFWIRWSDADAAGADDGLAVDDFSITARTASVAQPATFSVAAASGGEGTGVEFTVTRAGDASAAATLTWAVSAGTADAADFNGALPTGTVSFAVGATSASFHVATTDDDAYEGDEGFTVTLTGTDTGSIPAAGASAAGTILNDDAAAPARVRLFAENFTGFAARGFAPTPAAGQLDSDVWRVGGLSDDPTAAYGATLATGDFARGIINGAADPTGGGVYSPSANAALVVQPTGTDFEANGFVEARIVNGSGRTATSFDLGFDWAYRNSGDRASALGLSWSTDGVSFTAVPEAAFTTPAAKDAATAAVFAAQHETVTLSGLAVPGGDALYLRWIHIGSMGGGSRDEVGIDNLTVDATVTDDPLLFAGPITVAEGDGGTTEAVFTLTRSSGIGIASVDFATADGTATAGSDYLARSGTVTFAEGQTTATVSVTLIGDTMFEADETFSLNLADATGVLVPRASVTATIANDDRNLVAIHQIQGATHTSPLVGQVVATTGIVTAVDTTGFYLQDPTGDGDRATSDGIFVFTRTAPAVAVGDAVTATGTVSEYSADPGVGLTVTELDVASADGIAVTSHGNALPAVTLIGAGGYLPPSQVIGDDGLAYDPQNDGIDYYESLEGMLVTVDAPRVIANTNGFGETYVVASDGQGATGNSGRGGLTLSEGDANPERIQIDDDAGVFAGFTPAYRQGDHLSSVTGVVNYSFDAYEVLVTAPVAVTQASTLEREVTALRGDADHLAIATYNVENLDASDMKYDVLARDIVYNLGGPDILSLQEIQDDNGAPATGVLGADQNLTNLVNALNAADAAAHYVYASIAPAAEGSTGGEPGGNIRNAFVYDENRVTLVAGSLELIGGAAYTNSRNPLVGTFAFNGQDVTVVNVHSYSRGGSDPDFGAVQPAVPNGDDRRTAQADGVRAYIDAHLASDPSLNFAVMGDFNGFYWETAIRHLEAGGVLTNLNTLLPTEERYSYQFDGNLQQIDNMLVTGGLLAGARYDAVHINAEFAGERPTDHDPQLALLAIARLNAAPEALVLAGGSVAELAVGAVVGTLSATDPNGDALAYALTDTAGGLFQVNAATGVVTTTRALDYEAAHGYTIAATATDPAGLSVSASFAVTVIDVNEAPVAAGDRVAVSDDASTADLYAALLGNDADPEGDPLAISAVNTSGTQGHVTFDATTRTLVYTADADAFDVLRPGQTAVDRFSYTVTDAGGLTSTAQVEVTVTGIDHAGVVRIGGFFNDTLVGTDRDDRLYGLTGNDVLSGGRGDDQLWGGIGADRLDGGESDDTLSGGIGDDALSGGAGDDYLSGDIGNDTMAGGAGRDTFAFSYKQGKDTITDFDTALDRLLVQNGVDVTRATVSDVNRDGVRDLTLAFTGGGQLTLLNVADVHLVRIDHANLPLLTETLF